MGMANAVVDSFGTATSVINVGSGILMAGELLAAVRFLFEGRCEDPRIAAVRLSLSWAGSTCSSDQTAVRTFSPYRVSAESIDGPATDRTRGR